MNFAQYMFPNGERRYVSIPMPPEIEDMAELLVNAGYDFEIECNPKNGFVFMDCCTSDEQLANEICANGPEVPVKVEELVRKAYERYQKLLTKELDI